MWKWGTQLLLTITKGLKSQYKDEIMKELEKN